MSVKFVMAILSFALTAHAVPQFVRNIDARSYLTDTLRACGAIDEMPALMVTAIKRATSENLASLRQILEQEEANNNVNANLRETGATPLILAACSGQLETVSLLVEHGADINVANFLNGETALMAASQSDNDNAGLTWLMLEFGADLTATDKNGNSALHYAAMKGNRRVLQVLSNRGGEIDIRNKDVKTPLILASENGRLETVRLLLDLGADISNIATFNEAFNSNTAISDLLRARGANLDTPIVTAKNIRVRSNSNRNYFL